MRIDGAALRIPTRDLEHSAEVAPPFHSGPLQDGMRIRRDTDLATRLKRSTIRAEEHTYLL